MIYLSQSRVLRNIDDGCSNRDGQQSGKDEQPRKMSGDSWTRQMISCALFDYLFSTNFKKCSICALTAVGLSVPAI